LQEDKQPVFETADTLALMLPVMAGLLGSLRVHPQKMRQALDPALLATDLADYLVQRAIPFREAHGMVGQAVRFAQQNGLRLDQLSLEHLQAISPIFAADVAQVFDFQASVDRRSVTGGTASAAVSAQLAAASQLVRGDG
jgi:argininosuccinate lyase